MEDKIALVKGEIASLGGEYRGSRIFIANNSLAALKFMLSMNDYSYRKFGSRVFEYFGIERPSDRQGQSKYLDLLTDYKEVQEEVPEESFKNIDRICEWAIEFKCEYVWPGWGHASENPLLVRECLKKGLIFIGPSEESMRLLGEKIQANKLADSNGVPSIPWAEIDTPEKTKEFCRATGYPIMVKTPEGGGGKGIRIIRTEETLEQQIQTAMQETNSSKAFVTKYLEDIKHIELQIIADQNGNIEILSSRDCTLQRRNQKLIEEAPALLPEETINQMHAMARRLVQAAKYSNAGTIEFVYDQKTRQIYFLEANPRLQVEHTVTELLIDGNICVLQWMVANRCYLNKMKDRGLLGRKTGNHVVGARVIAESAEKGFTPSTGELSVSAMFPKGTVGYFATDAGVIGPYNDSQFGHVFGIGSTREEAINSLKMILESVKVSGGVKTLNSFLFDLISTEQFIESRHNTQYTEVFRQEWIKRHSADPFTIVSFIAIYSYQNTLLLEDLIFQVDSIEVQAVVTRVSNSIYAIEINKGVSLIEISPITETKYRIKNTNRVPLLVYCMPSGVGTYDLVCNGKTTQFKIGPTGDEVLAPCSGRIVRILAKEKVYKDQEYMEIESMKNILSLRAPREGTFHPKVSVGDLIKSGSVLVEISSTIQEKALRNTDKIECINTDRKYYNDDLFNGYPVPDHLLDYSTESILMILQKYVYIPVNKTNKYLDEYLSKSISIISDKSNDLFPYREIIKTIKYNLSINPSQIRVSILKKVQEIQEKIEKAKILEEYTETVQKIKASTIEGSITDKLSTWTILRLALDKSIQIPGLQAWALKTFNKKGTRDGEGIKFEFGGLSCAATTDKKLPNADLVFYLHHQSTQLPDLPEHGTVTVIEIQDHCQIKYKTYKNRVSQPIYNDIDPILADRLEIDKIHNPKFIKTIWNRRGYIYSSSTGVFMNFILNGNELNSPEAFDSLMKEVRVEYLLMNIAHPLVVSISVLTPFRCTATELSEYIRKLLLSHIFPLEEFLLERVSIKGMIGGENTLSVSDDHSLDKRCDGSSSAVSLYSLNQEHTITSPGIEESPFSACIKINRGFKEIFMCINQMEVFYGIDSIQIKNTDFTADQKNNTDQGPTCNLSEIQTRRIQAKHLQSIYIDDLSSLMYIFLKEMHPEAQIEWILPKDHLCAMKAWKYITNRVVFLLIGNDITQNNGSFSVNEDEFFTECTEIAKKEKIPFVYISSNSGAKIQVFQILKPIIQYSQKENMIYLTEQEYKQFKYKNQIEVQIRKIQEGPVYEITSILGEYGMGVENLSYSAQIAKAMVELYESVPTLTYVTGRAVGIGAYLARLGSRVIQKSTAPIILTGYQALNRLLQEEIYQSNLDLGGPKIFSRNGVTHRTVETETEGVLEILRWLDFISHPVPSTPPPRYSPGTMNIEDLNSEELVEYLSDKDTFVEYLPLWAPNVKVGRTKINGVSCGVIFPRVGTITTTAETDIPSGTNTPSQKTDNQTEKKSIVWTENVLFPETSKKIGQSIKDFSLEHLPILILANWKGFTATHTDMQEGILQHGAEIIQSMVHSQTPIFVYIGPNAELRGGSWVVFDKKIGNRIMFASHPLGTGSVIHPDGLSKIKFKEEEATAILERSEISVTPQAIQSLSHLFCKLHNTPQRMLKMNVIDKILPVSSLQAEILLHFQNNHT
ncbi:acetyl-CoA carboxylase / biotin carboxylase 1 [Nematocida sp. AWRm80]|nr:acetyl-CoA carboxylase / biotin carboxylase 1 [Nematocida sp. AWRm80]